MFSGSLGISSKKRRVTDPLFTAPNSCSCSVSDGRWICHISRKRRCKPKNSNIHSSIQEIFGLYVGFSSCVDAHRRAQDLICLVFRFAFASLRHAFQSLLRGSRRRRCLCGRHRLPGTYRAAGEPGAVRITLPPWCGRRLDPPPEFVVFLNVFPPIYDMRTWTKWWRSSTKGWTGHGHEEIGLFHKRVEDCDRTSSHCDRS